MKRILLISIFIFMLLPLSNQAQVSGYNGNRYIINAGIRGDILGFYLNKMFYDTGIEDKYDFNIDGYLELDYIFQRDKSIGLMLDFTNETALYRNVAKPEGTIFPYSYEGNKSASFPVKSSLIEFSLRWYSDGHIAPLGKYFKLMGGVQIASNEFDMDKYKSVLELYRHLDPNEYPSPSEVDIPFQTFYGSPYVGIGFGESFPIYENFFLDLGANMRVFLTNNYFLKSLFDGFNNNYKKEDIVKYDTVFPFQVSRIIEMNISLRYTF